MIIMCDFKKYPNCPKEIPDSMLNEKNANRIHMQSLKRLNERGGMSPVEIILNIEGGEYRGIINKHGSDEEFYINKLLKLIPQQAHE